MATEAKDNLILSSLLAVLQGINGPSTYLTMPSVAEGVPPDAVPSVDVTPRVYLHHVRTDPAPDAAAGGPTVHRWRARYDVWITSKSARTSNQVRADVLRAVYAAEGSLTTSYGQPVWPEDYARRDDLTRAGVDFAVLSLFIEYQTDHTET